jgi:1-aminocyclopropane-1-carboxylate deaminase/D-cysteine desulfhydrase-like pyridoxal-dependent ACC family enzyme
VITNTPIQKVGLGGKTIYVKREDMACESPGPPFSKVRGLIPYLRSIPQVKHIAYMETSISMAGWGVSYSAGKVDKEATIFYPRYKAGLKDNQAFQMEKWKEFGANIIPIKRPNMQNINFLMAKHLLEEIDPKALLLPLGLSFPQTVTAVARELLRTHKSFLTGSIVCSVGSGTMMAGIIRGLSHTSCRPDLYGVLAAKKGVLGIYTKIERMANCFHTYNLRIVSHGYEYTQAEECAVPFPCNKYYDRKAWKWMIDHIGQLKEPILFWNIGGDGK